MNHRITTMSKHVCCITRSSLGTRQKNQLTAIGRRHGYTFVYQGRVRGNDATGWFAGRNVGFPFDRDSERAIMADIEASGMGEFFAPKIKTGAIGQR